jgi:hypothetical protein
MASPPHSKVHANEGQFRDHPLFSLENIYRAYRHCRKHKRGTINALIFEQNLEENLVTLHVELNRGAYRPVRSMAFLVEKPKRREISTADFRDRVVHHILVGTWSLSGSADLFTTLTPAERARVPTGGWSGCAPLPAR